MIYGPEILNLCSNCNCIISRNEAISGNTFGAKFYSDGNQIGLGIDKTPSLIKCENCLSYLWIHKLQTLDLLNSKTYNNKSRKNYANFLSVEELQAAIKIGVADTNKEKIHIRKSLLFEQNNLFRIFDCFEDRDAEKKWTENIYELLTLWPDNKNNTEKLFLAELHRNTEQFEESISIINSIEDKELDWIKNQFILNCTEKNKYVFELKQI